MKKVLLCSRSQAATAVRRSGCRRGRLHGPDLRAGGEGRTLASDVPVVYVEPFIRLAVAQAEGPTHRAALAGLGNGSR